MADLVGKGGAKITEKSQWAGDDGGFESEYDFEGGMTLPPPPYDTILAALRDMTKILFSSCRDLGGVD